MIEGFSWSVQKICDEQIVNQNINKKDLLCNGYLRRYRTNIEDNTDRLEEIYNKRNNTSRELNNQFIVQLRGCPLHCTYCPLTQKGVLGRDFKIFETRTLIKEYVRSGCNVFHLSGGAPGIYLNHFEEIISNLDDQLFHSVLMLNERVYTRDTINRLSKYDNILLTVSVKGVTKDEYLKNTGVEFDEGLFWTNLDMLVSYKIPFYFTFTNVSNSNANLFREKVIDRYGNDDILDDAYAINFVDNM